MYFGNARTRTSMNRLLVAALAPLTAGCGAGWRRVDIDYLHLVEERQQVQVFAPEVVDRLHYVQLDSQSLSGFHFLDSPDCDTCRVTLARSEIDSVRVGNPTGGLFKGVGAFFGVTLALLAVYCTLNGPCTAGT